MKENYVSVPEAARLLGLRPSTVYRQIAYGSLSAERERVIKNYHYRVPMSAIEEYRATRLKKVND